MNKTDNKPVFETTNDYLRSDPDAYRASILNVSYQDMVSLLGEPSRNDHDEEDFIGDHCRSDVQWVIRYEGELVLPV